MYKDCTVEIKIGKYTRGVSYKKAYNKKTLYRSVDSLPIRDADGLYNAQAQNMETELAKSRSFPITLLEPNWNPP
jgi:hypothetical protein